MAKFNPVQYSKNVLRSAGYIGVETIKGINPNLTSLITETASVSKSMYSVTKDFLRNPKMAIREYIGEDAAQAASEVKHNILDDIRTGKFYNAERSSAETNKIIGEELGFNFDDLDLDVDEDYGEDKPSVGRDRAIGNLSITQQKLTQASTDTITANANANTTRSLTQQAKMFGVVNNSLSAINSSILNLHKSLAQPLNDHIQNSTNYYKTTTELMAKQTAYLENINKLLTDYTTRGLTDNRKGSGKNAAFKDVLGYGFDPNALMTHAKKNFIERTVLGQLKDIADPETIKMLRMSGALSSPISAITTLILTNYLQNGPIGTALGRTENIINSGINTGFQRIHSYRKANKFKQFNRKTGKYELKNKNPILGFLADVFDIMPDKGFKPNMSGNNIPDKRPTQWTGLNDKALREVIPTQLAEIISILTGEEPKIYNYNTGKFQRASNISRDFRKGRKKNTVDTANRFREDITDQFLSDANQNGVIYGRNSRRTKDLRDDFDTLVHLFAMSGKNVGTMTSAEFTAQAQRWVRAGLLPQKSMTLFKRYVFADKNLANFRSTLLNAQSADMDYINNNKYDNTFNTAVSAGLTTNEKYGKNKKTGSKTKAPNVLGTDNNGNDVFFYLQKYYTQLDYIVHRIETNSLVSGDSIGNNDISSRDSFSNFAKRSLHTIDNRTKEEKQQARLERRIIEHRQSNAKSKDKEKKYSRDTWNSSKKKYDKAGTGSIEYYDSKNEDNFVSNGINIFNDTLERIIFGVNPTRDDRNYGLLGPLKRIGDTVANIANEIKEYFRGMARNIWNKFKESDFWQRFTGKWASTGRNARDYVGNVTRATREHYQDKLNTAIHNYYNDKIEREYNDAFGDTFEAAHGGQVTKSGMVSVSEGELIIPSEHNPFYHGTTNKYSQKFNERKNYNKWRKSTGGRSGLKFWGFYDEGGTARNKADDLKDAANRYANKVKEETKGFETTAFADLLEKILGRLTEDIAEPAKKFFGDAYSNMGNIGKDALKVLKSQFPETMATGTMGALIGGALTGSGLGLLGGFVVGAGVNILQHSEAVSNLLFGGFDKENNEYRGGVLPKKFVNFMAKNAPNLIKSSILGSVLGGVGVIPGGILGGAAMVTTLQVLYDIKTIKESFQSVLFGEEGVDGKRRGGIVGSIKTRVVDPIADYVKKGLDNFGDYFKENFLNPLLKIFRPMSDWIAGKGIKMLEGVGNVLRKAAKESFGSVGGFFDATIGRALGLNVSVGKWALDKAAKIGTLPGKALTGLTDAWERHNVRAGYSTRSAQERVDLLNGKTSGYNMKLAQLQNAGKTDEANDLILNTDFYARGLDSVKGDAEQHRRETRNKVIASLTSGGVGEKGHKLGKDITRLMNGKAAQSGDFAGVISYVNSLTDDQMSAGNKKLVEKLLGDETTYITHHNEKVKDYNKNRSKFFKETFGIDIAENISDRKAEKILAKYGMKDQAYTDRRGLDKRLTDKFYGNIAKNNEIDKLRAQDPLEGDTNKEIHSIGDLVRRIADGIDKIVNKGKPAKFKEGEKRTNPITGVTEQFRNGKWDVDTSDSATNDVLDSQRKEKEEKKSFFDKITGFFSGANKKEKTETKKSSLWEKILGIGGGLLSGIGNFAIKNFLPIAALGFLTSTEPGKQISAKIFEWLENNAETIGNFVGRIFANAINWVGENISNIAGTITKIGSAIGVAVSAAVTGFLGASGGNAHSADSNLSNYNPLNQGATYEDKLKTEEAFKKRRFTPLGDFINAKNTIDTHVNRLLGKNMTTYAKNDYVEDSATTRVLKQTAFNTIARNGIGSIDKATRLLASRGPVSKVASAVLNPVGTIKNTLDDAGAVGSKLMSTGSKVLDYARSGSKAMEYGIKAGKMQTLAGHVYNAGSKVAQVGSNVANAVLSKVSTAVNAVLEKVFWALGKPMPEGIGGKLSEAISKALESAKGFASKAGAFLQAAGKVLYFANIANAVTEGLQSAGAKVILGIVAEPTLGQRILAAICNGLNAAIPLIGGLIPTEVLVNIIYAVLNPFIDFGDFEKQREAAAQELKEYNEANGTNYSLKEYLYHYYGEATIQTKVSMAAGQFLDTTKEFASNAGKAIGDTVSGAWDAVKTGAGNAWEGAKNFASNTWEGAKSTVGNIVDGGKKVVSNIFGKVSAGKDYVMEVVTSITNLRNKMQHTIDSGNFDIKTILSQKLELNKNNPLYSLANTASGVIRTVVAGTVIVPYIGKTIFGNITSGNKSPIEGAVDTVKNMIKYVGEGNVAKLMAAGTEGITGQSQNGIAGNIGAMAVGALLTPVKLALVIPTGLKGILNIITEKLEANNINVGNPIEGIMDTVSNLFDYVADGDIPGLMGAGITDQESDTGILGRIGSAAAGVLLAPIKMALVIPTGLKGIFNTITSKLASDKGINLDEMKKRLDEFKDPSKSMSRYDSIVEEYKKKAGDGIGGIGSKLAVSITAWIHKIPITISRAIKSIFGFFDGGFDKFKEWLLGSDADVNGGKSGAKIKNTTVNSTTGNKMPDYARPEYVGDRESTGLTIENSNTLKRKEHNANSWYTLDAGEYDDLASGSGIHVRQEGRERYGGSTLGEVGCGPAAAATVLRAYGKGSDLRSAAAYARNRGYEVGGESGTRAGYFNDVFSANGIKSNYVAGGGLEAAVSSGKPTVLLGQDKSNTSKANSPFGPKPHYVVASGTDNHGNVFVDDPELNRTALYPRSAIRRGAKFGIATGGESGVNDDTLMISAGNNVATSMGSKAEASSTGTGSVNSNTLNITAGSNAATTGASGLPRPANNVEAIWGYYKALGLSDNAVAGILGNMKTESADTYDPKTLEYLFIHHLQGKDSSERQWSIPGNIYKDYGVDVSSYNTAWDTYTKALDSGKISLDEFQHPYKEYVTKTGDTRFKSTRGHEWLQYGYGLVGFTTPEEKQNLYNYTLAKGKSAADLGGQLDALTDQLKNTGVYQQISNGAVSARDAAKIMLMDYEKPDNASGQIGSRGANAEEFLQKYGGKNFDINGYISSASSIGSKASNTGTAMPNFPKYQLDANQIRGLANILGHEQGPTNYRGLYAEASLMANLAEAKYGEANAQNLIRMATGGWFANGSERYNTGKSGGSDSNITDQSIGAATDVFVNGHRIFPRYVNEHDMLGSGTKSDIGYITDLNGKPAGDGNKFNRSNYIKDQTVIYQSARKFKNPINYRFFAFPDGVDGSADPFGYTTDNANMARYEKYKDEGYYQVDANGNVTVGQMGVSGNGFTDSSTYTSGNESTNAFDIGSIVNKFFRGIFSKAIEGASGAVKGMLKMILGDSSTEDNTNTSQENQGTDTTKVGVQDSSFGTTNAVTSKANDFPYYNQGDAPWGDKMYQYDTYRNSACGPTSMAMVMKSYGLNVTPEDTGRYAIAHGHRIKGSGTGHEFFQDIGAANGLTVDRYGGHGEAKSIEYLKKGVPVLVSHDPGHFTRRGHFVVLTGIDSNDNIYVNDPSSRERTSHSWLKDHVFPSIKQSWAITKDGKGSLGTITPTQPSTVGSRIGGSSGLPIYNFTGGASDALALTSDRPRTTATVTPVSKPLDYNEVYERMLKIMAQIAANTANNAYLPTIVELIKQLSQVVATVNGNNSTTSIAAEDAKKNAQQDLTKIMAKLDQISMSL